MSSNVARVYEYLKAIEARGSYESVAKFYAADVTFREFPNRTVPNGRVSGAGDLRTAYEKGLTLMKSQRYQVQRILESGDEVAVELAWTGVLAIPVMSLPAGSEMKAYVAMFLTFRDGRIREQRNYDCYPPFESQGEQAKLP
jgi:ketosteroid isomerase-like protein